MKLGTVSLGRVLSTPSRTFVSFVVEAFPDSTTKNTKAHNGRRG
jgi:hypothetical protein